MDVVGRNEPPSMFVERLERVSYVSNSISRPMSWDFWRNGVLIYGFAHGDSALAAETFDSGSNVVGNGQTWYAWASAS